MKIALLVIVAMFLSAQASDQTEREIAYKKLHATYAIYSGELNEKQAPTRTDRKLAIEITGPAAKEIFDSLYPDAKVRCSDTKGERLRSKRDVWCIFHPPSQYRCFLGFDLRTGNSIPGASC